MKITDAYLRWLRTPDLEFYERLAASRKGPMRKGDKHTAEVRAKIRRLAKERNARLRALVAQATLRCQPGAWSTQKKRQPGIGALAYVDRFFAVLEPECWYAVADVVKTSGLPYETAKGYLTQFYQAGLLKRAENPDWHAQRAFEGKQPKWLYMLTPAGMSRRALALALR